MTENTDNLVLEHLRAIRGDLRGLKDDMRDVKARLASTIKTYLRYLHYG